MSAYELARELARALRESEEYIKFMDVKKEIMANEGNRKMMRDLQVKQWEIQQAQMFQEDIDAEKQQDLERLYSLLSLNPRAREYLEAEFEVSRLINDVQTIIGEAVQEALPVGFEDLVQ
ncbi:MAG: YlbF family regulator [Desulfitobacteriaceae bacterium]